MNKLKHLLLFLFAFKLQAQPPSKWFNKFGGSGIDIGYGIKETYNRQFIVCGSTTSFGSGAHDAHLLLIDSMGQKIWEKTYGGVMTDVAKSVVINPSDSGFVFVGYTNSIGFGGYDLYAARTDKNGNLIWQKSFGGIDWDFGNDIAMASDGNIVLCGYTFNSKYGKTDGYVLKVSITNGSLIWEKKFGGSEDDEFRSILIKGSNIVATGETKSFNDIAGDIFLMKFNLNGDSLFSKTYGLKNKEDYANTIIENYYQNGFVLGGGTESYSSFGKDAFIFGINSAGDSTWLVNYGNANLDQETISVLPTSSSTGTYVISYSDVTSAVFNRNPKNLILNDVGIYYSGHDFGSFEDDELYDLVNTSDKGFIGVGYTNGFGSVLSDIFVVKYDSSAIEGNSLVGIKEHDGFTNNEIKVYPTLISGQNQFLNVKTEFSCTTNVSDIFGNIVYSDNSKQTNDLKIDFMNLNSGIYFLSITSNGITIHIKVVKE